MSNNLRLIIFGNASDTFRENIKKSANPITGEIFFYKKPEMFLAENNFQENDIFISVANSVKIPEPFLSKPNFNIHFAPNTRRGVGGFAYAMSRKLGQYMIVAHKMVEKFDLGVIYKTVTYNITPGSFNSLLENTEANAIGLITSLAIYYEEFGNFPVEDASWEGKLHGFAEMKENLLKIPEVERKLLEQYYFGAAGAASGYYDNNPAK